MVTTAGTLDNGKVILGNGGKTVRALDYGPEGYVLKMADGNSIG